MYLAPLGTEIAVFYPDMLLLSGNTREKVTFLGSTTRMKVTFDPENGDLPGANSREKVTMHPEKGDFSRPNSTIRNYPEKGGLLFPVFRGSPMETVIFTVPTIYPEKGDLFSRFQ
jgi:hypothetical protein